MCARGGGSVSRDMKGRKRARERMRERQKEKEREKWLINEMAVCNENKRSNV